MNLGSLAAGDHSWELEFDAKGFPASSYLYHVEVRTDRGRFTDVKRMTSSK